MLDLSQVITDISDMGLEARRRFYQIGDETRQAHALSENGEIDWAAISARANERGVRWQCARLDGGSPFTVASLAAGAPAVYTAIATDGSQIPLDRHAVAPCYLLNVGEIVLHYGTGERSRLTSQAKLYYKEDEIMLRTGDGDAQPLSEKILANRRFLAESKALAGLIAENAGRPTAVALVDDPLIVWTPPREAEAEQRSLIVEFCEMLEAGRAAGIPVAGYVSRPGHRDVVGLLRLALCQPGCPHAPGSPCASLVSLTDARLFQGLLGARGDRSPVFASAAPSVEYYPDEHRVFFFYLNAGTEIARVEIPRWVAGDPDLLDRVQTLVTDQAIKGQGYPVSLAEAHERAVVRAAERDAFFRLVEAAFVRQKVPALVTRKALSKRRRLV
jgi:hypothetical protein